MAKNLPWPVDVDVVQGSIIIYILSFKWLLLDTTFMQLTYHTPY